MNLANKLTIFRIILVLAILLVSLLPIESTFLRFFIIDILFILASITDKLDGYIARKRNEITEFGKMMDSAADKMLVLTAMTLLVAAGRMPSWILIVTIMRDFLVTGYKTKVSRGASKAGKVKAVFQMVGLSVALVDVNQFGAAFTGQLTGFAYYLNVISTGLITVAVIATIISGLDYLREGIQK